MVTGDLDPLLVQATQWQESRGDPDAISPKGAVGDMQTMPGTLTDPGYGVAPAKDDSPEELHRVGVDYLKAMHNKYKDPNLALVAYNYGPKNTDRWIDNGADPKELPKETQEYVKNVHQKYQELAQNTVVPMAQNTQDVEKNLSGSSDDPDIQLMYDHQAAQQPKAPEKVEEEDPDIQLMRDHVETEASNPHVQRGISQPIEAGPEWLQDVGRVGGNIANTVGNATYKGTQTIGEGMTPFKMAAIVPTLAIAPALSAGAAAVEGVPYIGAAANALAGAAPEGSGLVSDISHSLVGGAAQGAAANAFMGGSPIQGAENGAVLNPALNVAGKIASPILSAVTGYGGSISPEVAKLAQTASNKYGINVPGGLLNENLLVNRTFSLLDRLGMTPGNENSANFAKAAASSFGENTTKLTRDVMDRAEDRIGDMFDDVWKQTPQLKISPKILNQLTDISDEAATVAPNDTRIQKQIDNLIDIAAKNNGAIPAADAKFLTSTKSPLHKLSRLGPDPVADYATDVKNAIYDSLGENAPQDVLDKFSQAKKYYKNYKTVELAKPDPVTGELRPTSIAGAVSRQAKKFGSGGLEDLQTLGDIGKQFALSPSSGTAENTILGNVGQMLMQHALHLAGPGAAIGGGYLAGGPIGAAISYGTGKGVGAYLNSEMYRNHLIDSALNQTPLLNLLKSSPEISNSIIAAKQASGSSQ